MRNKFFAIKLEKGRSMIESAWIVATCKFLSIKLQKGVTMIEYALIASLIAIVAITAIKIVGTNLKNEFSKVATNLK